MHEIRGGMCCFAAERHGRWGWGEGEVWSKRGGAKRRGKPAKQKNREKEPGEKLLVNGKNGPRREDSIVIDVLLSPTSPVISKITHAYNTLVRHSKGAVPRPGQDEAALRQCVWNKNPRSRGSHEVVSCPESSQQSRNGFGLL